MVGVTVTILGCGAWGTAVATLLAANGCNVKMWCFEPDVAQMITQNRCNERYLPGVLLDDRISAVTDLQEAFSASKWIFEATPVKFLRPVLESCKPFYSKDQVWVVLSKGIENDTLMLPGQMIDDVFGTKVNKAVVAGPSFAKDLALKQPTAVTVAADNETVGKELQAMLSNDYFRPYRSDDILGMQLGGAFKNVLTIGIGILEGSGFGDNTKAFLFMNGFREMMIIAEKLGANPQTLYGFSGVGDLVLTSMGGLSRNLAVGKRLGAGHTLGQILEETGFIPEGINAVRSIHQLCQKHNLKLPVFDGLFHVIFGTKTMQELLKELMERPLELD